MTSFGLVYVESDHNDLRGIQKSSRRRRRMIRGGRCWRSGKVRFHLVYICDAVWLLSLLLLRLLRPLDPRFRDPRRFGPDHAVTGTVRRYLHIQLCIYRYFPLVLVRRLTYIHLDTAIHSLQ